MHTHMCTYEYEYTHICMDMHTHMCMCGYVHAHTQFAREFNKNSDCLSLSQS